MNAQFICETPSPEPPLQKSSPPETERTASHKRHEEVTEEEEVPVGRESLPATTVPACRLSPILSGRERQASPTKSLTCLSCCLGINSWKRHIGKAEKQHREEQLAGAGRQLPGSHPVPPPCLPGFCLHLGFLHKNGKGSKLGWHATSIYGHRHHWEVKHAACTEAGQAGQAKATPLPLNWGPARPSCCPTLPLPCLLLKDGSGSYMGIAWDSPEPKISSIGGNGR